MIIRLGVIGNFSYSNLIAYFINLNYFLYEGGPIKLLIELWSTKETKEMNKNIC